MRRSAQWCAKVLAFGTLAVVGFCCLTGETPLAGFQSLARRKMEERDRYEESRKRLMVISSAVALYQRHHEGKAPASLADLASVGLTEALRSPLGGQYVLTGKGMGNAADEVCREECVADGGHVLYGDGEIRWVRR